MNPNLPVGGSAFDLATINGAEPEGISVLGFAYGFSLFDSHLAGSESIDPVRTESIDAHLFNLSLEHHFGAGIAAGIRAPIGSIRVDGVGADPTFVSGFGDIVLHASYELGALWGRGGYKPSVRVRPLLVLPTGETRRTADPADDAPPNLIALGSGAIGAGLEVQASKYLAKSWALRGQFRARTPLSFNDQDLRFGASIASGVGGLFRPRGDVFLSLDAVVQHRRSSRERSMGRLVNSGGDWVTAELGAGYVAAEGVVLGASARAPLYANVNGEQVSQTFSVGAFISLTFGGKKDEDGDEHDHGDGDKHDHGKDMKGMKGDEHDHAGDMKDGKHSDHDKHAPGDVAVLASGGTSFEIAAAAVAGKVVVIDFWAEWCGPCKHVTALLEKRAAAEPRLAVRKVEVPTFETPVAKQHLAGVSGLPVVWILDANGVVIRKLVAVKLADLERALDEVLGSEHPAH